MIQAVKNPGGLSILHQAIEYAEVRGWSVLPIHNPIGSGCSCSNNNCSCQGKHPRIKDWPDKATTDVNQIERWCQQEPDTNIGIATGEKSGIVVVDIDGPEGLKSIKELFNGNPPITLTGKTGGGGIHLVYAYPTGLDIGNKVRLLPGVDIRGNGGCIVAPPSLHKSGSKYSWVKGYDKINPLPSQFIDLLSKEAVKPGNPLTNDMFISEGSRNNEITKLVGSLVGSGCSRTDVLNKALAHNQEYCNPPLPETEITTIVNSIYKRETKKSKQPQPSQYKAKVVCIADVVQENVSWLWKRRVPYGKVTLLEGDPGVGKSTLTCKIAAAVTTGESLEDNEVKFDKPHSVLFLCCEDGIADTIKPRLIAAGADYNRCFVLSGVTDEYGNSDNFSLPNNLDALREEIIRHDTQLVIIDPLLGYVNGSINSHKDQEIRQVMSGLGKIAEETGAAIIAIRHLNKKQTGSPLQRGMGSTAIGAVARSILLVAKMDEDEYVLAVVKNNISKHGLSVRYRIVSAGNAGKVHWLGVSDLTAGDLLDPIGENLICDFLNEELKDGPKSKSEIIKAASDKGITVSERTLRRKIQNLGGSLEIGGKQGMWGFAVSDACPTVQDDQ